MEPRLPHFTKFASTVTEIYAKDPEGFWNVTLGQFLEYFSRPQVVLGRTRSLLRLAWLLRGLEKDAAALVGDFDRRWGTDLLHGKSHRRQYLRDAFPVFILLAVWLHEEGQTDILAQYEKVLTAGVYAVVGYGVQDHNLDSERADPVELLAAQALLAEYEQLCYEVFGGAEAQRRTFHRIRATFLGSEIREKRVRGRASPYELGRPADLGTKGLHATAPFVLALGRAGKDHLTDQYLDFFLLIGAVIQLIDDWEDLDEDLSHGHFSYVVLGSYPGPKGLPPDAPTVRADLDHVRRTYREGRDLLDRAASVLAVTGDRVLGRLLGVTEHRFEGYYLKTFGLGPRNGASHA